MGLGGVRRHSHGAVMDGKTNHLLLVFSLARYFDLCMSLDYDTVGDTSRGMAPPLCPHLGGTKPRRYIISAMATPWRGGTHRSTRGKVHLHHLCYIYIFVKDLRATVTSPRKSKPVRQSV